MSTTESGVMVDEPSDMTEPSSGANPAEDAGVIRIARLVAASGRIAELITAAHTNAAEARAAGGCISAEAVRVPGEEAALQVISRWVTLEALQHFLSWHEGIAHRLIAEASEEQPVATHFPVVAAMA